MTDFLNNFIFIFPVFLLMLLYCQSRRFAMQNFQLFLSVFWMKYNQPKFCTKKSKSSPSAKNSPYDIVRTARQRILRRLGEDRA